MITKFNKRKAIAKIMKRSVDRMNSDKIMREDAERFGECSVGIVIKNLYGGMIGDFNGSYINNKFTVNVREQNTDKYDAIVTVTEDAFINLCNGTMTPSYAFGIGGIQATGDSAYKLMVVGLSVGELLYDVLKD